MLFGSEKLIQNYDIQVKQRRRRPLLPIIFELNLREAPTQASSWSWVMTRRAKRH